MLMRFASKSLSRLFSSSVESHLPLVGRANAAWSVRRKATTLQQQFVSSTTVVRLRGFASSSSSSQEVRPFCILGVQQIAIGCAERAPLNRLWVDIFGLTPAHTGITIASENVTEDILKVGRGASAVEVDLMTPIDPEKSPKVRSYIHTYIHTYSCQNM
jgi:hypothetical protein